MPEAHGLAATPAVHSEGPFNRLPIGLRPSKGSGARDRNDAAKPLFQEESPLSAVYREKLIAANSALQASELRYQTLLDCSPNAILVGRNGTIELVNKAAAELFGVPLAGLLIGKRFVDFVSPEDQVYMQELLEQLYARELHHPLLQIRICRSDGRVINTEVSSSSFIENGEIVVQGIFRDITRQNEREARNSQLFRGIEQVAESIIIADLNGTITYVNPAFEKTTGYTQKEIIGSNARILQSGQYAPSFYQTMWAALLRGETWSGDMVNKRKDGSLFTEVATISPIKNRSGVTTSFVAVKRDMTQDLILRKRLNQAQKMEAIGQLTGGIAHDFNNLLGVVFGNLELLETLVPGNDTALQHVRTAQHAANRGADLTRRLLAFSRGAELRPVPTDLHESICNTIELARTVGPKVRITSHFDTSIPLLLVDAAGLESALLNLVVNARDAMPNGGALTITTRLSYLEQGDSLVDSGELQSGTYARISVADTGHGMSKETLDRVFEPFFTTKPEGKGTGLGLAMVYGFVRHSGGSVRIDSEPGCGTTVTFYLQLAEAVPRPGSASTMASNAAVLSSIQPLRKILVVDDEPALLEVTVIHLERMGFTVYAADNGASAVEIAARHGDIDLLITDVIMPGGMDGLELAQRIRQSVPRVKVVYSSGFTAEEMENGDMPPVFGTVLLKPYRRADLETAVRAALQ